MYKEQVDFRGKTDFNKYFSIQKSKYSRHNIDSICKLFNIDNYIIIKSTRHFKIVSKEDFYNMKYAGYVFYHKDKFNEKLFNEWNILIKSNKLDILFLIRIPIIDTNIVKIINYEDLK